MRKADTVLTIPCGDVSKPVATMVKDFQGICDLWDRLLLFKKHNNPFSLPVRIATQPQHMVNVTLGKRKSRGCSHILCFVYVLNLFRFGEEQV